MKIREAEYFWIWILLLSPNLICRNSILICSLLLYWLLNMTYSMTELESVINVRVVTLYVCFLIILNHQIWVSTEKVMIKILKSVQSESELNSDFLSFIFILWCKQSGSNWSPSLSLIRMIHLVLSFSSSRFE